MRGVMMFYLVLRKSGFGLDRAKKFARFVGQCFVILTTGATAGEQTGDDLSHRKRSLVFIQRHTFIFLSGGFSVLDEMLKSPSAFLVDS